MSLVETEWLQKNLDSVKIIDCSWHMPQTKRNGFDEYKKQHIPNAIFFDLDDNSKKNTNLPHMLIEINSWDKIISKMGIKNDDKIIIYDNSDVISSCRCWFNFIYFGHDPKLIYVLNGGLKKWIKEKRKITNDLTDIQISNYKSFEKKELVKNKEVTREMKEEADELSSQNLDLSKKIDEARIESIDKAVKEPSTPVTNSEMPVATIGSSVIVKNLTKETEHNFELVNPDQVDPKNGKIPLTNPIGKALEGAKEGDEVKVGANLFKILKLN